MSVEERYERLHTLLVRRASEGCSEEEAAEIETLHREFPDVLEDDWDLLAARAELELHGIATRHSIDALEKPPASLRSALTREAPRFARAKAPRSRVSALPWFAAAAAGFAALYFATLTPRLDIEPESGRASLIERQRDVITLPWKRTEDPAAAAVVTGDVVWSDDAQSGYMRFINLAANDPEVEQYQLWIFDKTRPEATPVDGGVFDIPAGSEEVVVPINAKLAVGAPHLFAVTVEKPGGVVVSDRSRIAVLGAVTD